MPFPLNKERKKHQPTPPHDVCGDFLLHLIVMGHRIYFSTTFLRVWRPVRRAAMRPTWIREGDGGKPMCSTIRKKQEAEETRIKQEAEATRIKQEEEVEAIQKQEEEEAEADVKEDDWTISGTSPVVTTQPIQFTIRTMLHETIAAEIPCIPTTSMTSTTHANSLHSPFRVL